MQNIGTSTVEVSKLSLGSWNTYSRLSFEANIELLNHAQARGINFFDIAYYRDKPHTEVLFGRMLQEAAFSRDDVVIAEKVWFFNYPEQSLADQLDASMRRLAVERVDVVIVEHLREGFSLEAVAREAAGLVTSGRARVWGGLNWRPEHVLEAHQFCEREGLPGPQLVQLKYSVVRQNVVDGAQYRAVLDQTGISVQASDSLEGGILAGNLNPERMIGLDIGGIRDQIRARVPQISEIARSFGVTEAEFSLAFAASKAEVASVLFGATKPQQIDAAVAAIELAEARTSEVRAAALPLGIDENDIDPPYQQDRALVDGFVA